MNEIRRLRSLLGEGRKFTNEKLPDYDPNSDAYLTALKNWDKQVGKALAEARATTLYRKKLDLVLQMPIQNHDERPDHDWQWRMRCHALEWTISEIE